VNSRNDCLIAAAACLCLCLGFSSSRAQESLSSHKPLLKVEAVEYLFPEQVTVPVGKPSAVALHFRIKQDLHINSHRPHDQYLIPTEFSIPEASGVRLTGAVYPDGSDFTLPADPSQKLSVYTGEFTIQTKMVATAGDHLVEAKLRYQACDQNACMPPKTITVPIDVIGK
jgi:hypothetical protein